MNKIQKFGLILAAVALTAGTTQVYALSENWGAAVSRFLTLAGGTTGLPSGDLIEIGIVTSNNAAAAASATSGAQLQALMTVFGSSTIGTGTGVDGSFSTSTTAPGAGFFTGQVYLMAFNASTAAAATQGGLFTSTDWTFAASDASAPNTAELSDALVTASRGTLSSATVTAPGDIAGGDSAALVPFVPEPSTYALLVMSLLGMLSLRRRRS